MSRTFNTVPRRVRFKEYYDELESKVFTGFVHFKVRGILTKKKRNSRKREAWNFMATPMWFIKEFSFDPQRKRSKRYERKVINLVDLEEADFPPIGRKPHVYYW